MTMSLISRGGFTRDPPTSPPRLRDCGACGPNCSADPMPSDAVDPPLSALVAAWETNHDTTFWRQADT
jgi:hypothetical protein